MMVKTAVAPAVLRSTVARCSILLIPLSLVVGAPGCAVLLGIEPGSLDDGVAGPNASVGPRGSDPKNEGGPGSVAEVVPPVVIPPSCNAETPNDANGLFVSLSGKDDENCGSPDVPCKSLQKVIDRAGRVAGTTIVYVDSGDYAET